MTAIAATLPPEPGLTMSHHNIHGPFSPKPQNTGLPLMAADEDNQDRKAETPSRGTLVSLFRPGHPRIQLPVAL